MPSFLPKPVSPVLQRGDPLARGLVAAWPFFEGAGSAIHDFSGNGNNPVLSSGHYSWAAGPFGTLLRFNGTGTYPPDPALISPTITLTASSTIVVWTDAAADGMLMGNSTLNRQVRRYRSGTNNVSIYDGTSEAISSTFSTPAGLPVMCSFVFSAGSVFFYENLTPRGSAASIATAVALTGLGGAISQNLTGSVDGVLIYRRALSANEIAQLYQDPFRLYRPRSRLWEYATSAAVADTLMAQACL